MTDCSKIVSYRTAGGCIRGIKYRKIDTIGTFLDYFW